MSAALQPGDRVTVDGQPATFRGLNDRSPGDYWIEFDWGGGWWSYHPSDVQPRSRGDEPAAPEHPSPRSTSEGPQDAAGKR